ncbi:hypothetical protein D3C86_1387290 [compost metagenome]
MRLVHREARDGDALDRVHEGAVLEALGSDVDELVLAGCERGETVLGLVGIQAAVDEGGGDPLLEEGVHLVLHQGDEGRDDERRALEHQGGQLVADGLAVAGRHDGDGVATRKHRLDHALLARAEGRVTEMPQERGFGRTWRGVEHNPSLLG